MNLNIDPKTKKIINILAESIITFSIIGLGIALIPITKKYNTITGIGTITIWSIIATLLFVIIPATHFFIKIIFKNKNKQLETISNILNIIVRIALIPSIIMIFLLVGIDGVIIFALLIMAQYSTNIKKKASKK